MREDPVITEWPEWQFSWLRRRIHRRLYLAFVVGLMGIGMVWLHFAVGEQAAAGAELLVSLGALGFLPMALLFTKGQLVEHRKSEIYFHAYRVIVLMVFAIWMLDRYTSLSRELRAGWDTPLVALFLFGIPGAVHAWRAPDRSASAALDGTERPPVPEGHSAT